MTVYCVTAASSCSTSSSPASSSTPDSGPTGAESGPTGSDGGCINTVAAFCEAGPCVSTWTAAQNAASWCAVGKQDAGVSLSLACAGSPYDIAGTQEGVDCADLYLYDHATGDLLQITNECTQAIYTCVAGPANRLDASVYLNCPTTMTLFCSDAGNPADAGLGE